MKITFYCHVFLILFVTAVSGQDVNTGVEKRKYTTKRIVGSKPSIDGVLDDAAWDLVAWTGDFVEWRPDENSAPGQETMFKILYDAKYLYVGVQCMDTSPDKIVKRMSRRDGFEGDWIEMNIDSYHDKRTAFSFNVNAAGVKGDEFVSNNGANWDASWNPIWYVKTQVNTQGWTAEMKIPLSQLRFGKGASQVWGLQMNRRLFREEERSLWQRIPLDAPGWVSEFGELHGLINLESQKQLEIQPYSLLSYETYPEEAGNPFEDGTDFGLSAGLDAKIGITNDLTLDLTVNPDFGQVEADPAAIALDGFQLFFQEQRPFFVENKNIFDYQFAGGNDNLFYSRRIGRSPQRKFELEDGEYIESSDKTTILGAAKFSGKTTNGWSIGVLETVTSQQRAKIWSNGAIREEIAEPMTNYFVSRVQKDFNNRNSFLGGILTTTHRASEIGTDFLHSAAYAVGLDFKHNWKDRTFYLEGNVVGSHVKGSADAIKKTQNSLAHLFQRVDASHVAADTTRTSLTGTGGKLEFGKAGSGHISYELGTTWRSPELELNDIGFMRRTDRIFQYGNVAYRTLRASKHLRRFSARLEQFSRFDFEGNFNELRFETNVEINFLNNWGIDVGGGRQARLFSNAKLRGGPRFRFSKDVFNYAFVGSDSRKKLSFSTGYVVAGAKQKNFSLLRWESRITYQPTNALKISVVPEFIRRTRKTQYVTEADFDGVPRYVLGSLKQQTLSASLRLNYNITPNMTVQYYGQPFVSKGEYANLKYVTNPIAKDLNDRFSIYDDQQKKFDAVANSFTIDDDRDGIVDYTIDDPDFAFVQFRSNLVFRWEYIPGSELFLVWSQGTSGDGIAGDHLFRSLDNQILGQQLENVFLIKATYRFLL